MNTNTSVNSCSQSFFQGVGGIRLFWQRWHPELPMKGVVVFIHGIGDHGGRHESLVGALIGSGFAIYAYDSPPQCTHTLYRGNYLASPKRL